MKTDLELTNKIEAYLRGELSAAEQAEFDQLRASNPAIDQEVVEHKNFMKQMAEYGERDQLAANMNAIHEQLDIAALKDEALPQTVQIRSLWKKYRINTAIAASVAMIAVLSTMLSTGYFSKTVSTNYSALRREINNIKRSQNAIIKNINTKPPVKGPSDPVHFGGTGFALSADGYVVTNYHVIKDADSVYIQNTKGESFKVKQIYANPAYDIAILQIIDPNFKALPSLPYSFKKSASDLGENVYTIGFPREEEVIGKGYLSSRTGFNGDSVAYQVDIPVNPGNSGGPLLDSKGNIIGIISGKQTQSDGAAFAIKSKYLLETLEAIPAEALENNKLVFNKKNTLSTLSHTDQIKKLQDYIFMVKVY